MGFPGSFLRDLPWGFFPIPSIVVTAIHPGVSFEIGKNVTLGLITGRSVRPEQE